MNEGGLVMSLRARKARRPNPSVGDHRGECGCLFHGKRGVSPSLKEMTQDNFSPTGEPLPSLMLQKALAGVRG